MNNPEARRWAWDVLNWNMPGGGWNEIYAVSHGATEDQAKARAEQIVAALDGAERK
jgi:hypothetical protein